MPSIAEISAGLMRDAAGLLRTLGTQHAELSQRMFRDAQTFEQVADLLEGDPTGALEGGEPFAAIGAGLLRDAAGLFRLLGDQNKPLAEQMNQNADVFTQVADMLAQDPLARIDE